MTELLTRLPAAAEATVVRRLAPADVERFHGYRCDADLAAYQGWSPMSLEAARDFIAAMSSIERFGRDAWVQLGIADAATGVLIGDIGLFVEADASVAEIGLTLSRSAQGKGHARRAIALAQALVFASTPVRCLRAVTDARNLPSIRMLERSRFTRCHMYETDFKGQACKEVLFVSWRPGETSADPGGVPEPNSAVQSAGRR